MSTKIERMLGDKTQTDLADACDTTQACISMVLAGKRTPNVLLAKKLAEALSVTLDVLADALTEAVRNDEKRSGESE